MSRHPSRLIIACAAALTGITATVLAGLWAMGGQPWFRDAAGSLLAMDFLTYRAIALASIDGQVAASYDPAVFAERLQALGTPSHGLGLRWLNPPHFALVLAPLAFLSLDTSFVVFILATATLALGALRLAFPSLSFVSAALLALGSPAAYTVIVKGQNGFLTAALIGAGLIMLDRRPVVAGILLGLLSIKPQFGIFLPVLLLLGRHWQALASATATVLACVMLSAAFFGLESWTAFARSIGGAGAHFLEQGREIHAMHSIFAMLSLQIGAPRASVIHGIVTAIAFLHVAWLWHRDKPPPLRNAATIGLAFLTTPYVFNHDVPMLVFGAAILLWSGPTVRLPLGSGILLAALVLMTPFPLFPNHGAPGALLAATLIILASVAARHDPTTRRPAAPDRAAARNASRAA